MNPKNYVISIIPIVFFVLVGVRHPVNAKKQETNEENMIQPRRLIDAHTAGILPKAYYDFETRIYSSGSQSLRGCGLNIGISVGISHRLNIGISYGGDGFIGRGDVKGNPYPGGLIKYRIFEEKRHFPGVAIGYEHQGYGGIEENSYVGFVYKSQGFFLAMSKNYLILKKLQLGIHGAVNFSLEEIRTVKWPNCYLGIDFGINEELALSIEYDFALNQKDLHSENYRHPFRGFFNVGVRWAFDPSFYIELDAKDIFQQKRISTSLDEHIGWSREIKIVYISQFFR